MEVIGVLFATRKALLSHGNKDFGKDGWKTGAGRGI